MVYLIILVYSCNICMNYQPNRVQQQSVHCVVDKLTADSLCTQIVLLDLIFLMGEKPLQNSL